jgi:hypothetical protein
MRPEKERVGIQIEEEPTCGRCGKVDGQSETQNTAKTYNSGYSLVVTHLTTNPPVRCLNRAERTGSLVFNVLWSYVTTTLISIYMIAN